MQAAAPQSPAVLLVPVYGFTWLYASETVLIHLTVLVRLNFDDYCFLTAVNLAGAIAALTFVFWRAKWQGISGSLSLGILAVLLALLTFTRRDLLPLCVVAFALGFVGARLVAASLGDADRSPIAAYEGAAVVALALATALVTYLSHRPDADDGGFLDIVISTLQYPDRPLFGFDASHGELLPQFRFIPYAATSYEVLVAIVARTTGCDPLVAYYGIVPSLSAGLCVLVLWALAREIAPDVAAPATVICVLIILAWGETHIAYGNRIFVRFFQGKGSLIGIAVPLCVLTGIRFMRAPGVVRWTFLCSSQIMALGMSSSGLIVGPLAAVVGVTAALIAGHGRSMRTCLAAAAGFGYLAVAAVIIAVVAPRGIGGLGTILPVTASLGEMPRTFLSAAIAALAVLLWLRGAPALPAALTVACVVLPLNPLVGLLAKHLISQNMGWRIAWAAPVPLVLAVVLAQAMSRANRINRTSVDLALGIVAVVLLCGFLVAGRWSLAPSNNVTFSLAAAKTPPEYEEAREVASMAFALVREPVVLAPDPIATWLPAQTGKRVQLVMAGHTYPLLMRFALNPEIFDRRFAMFNIITGRAPWHAETFRDEIQKQNVSIVVLDDRIAGTPNAAETLASLGFVPTRLQSAPLVAVWARAAKPDGRGAP